MRSSRTTTAMASSSAPTLVVLVLGVVAGMARATIAATPTAGNIIPWSKASATDLAKNVAAQPVIFIANIKLKPGADVDKFIATREAVVARGKKKMPFPFSVVYVKGAMPPKTETLPQGAAKLEYFPIGVISTMPDAKSYAEYNAWASKEPDYVESGKSVEHVVRSVNIQM